MKLRVVVADDAAFIHEVLTHLFSFNDLMIVGHAYDGQEAVDLVLQERPDVVLMDVVMPKKNGLEATREILQKRPETKIIACSTVTDENFIMQFIEAGCCNFIAKPFSGQELVEMIKKSAGSVGFSDSAYSR